MCSALTECGVPDTDGGWLGQHQDKDESQETLDAGEPALCVLQCLL